MQCDARSVRRRATCQESEVASTTLSHPPRDLESHATHSAGQQIRRIVAEARWLTCRLVRSQTGQAGDVTNVLPESDLILVVCAEQLRDQCFDLVAGRHRVEVDESTPDLWVLHGRDAPETPQRRLGQLEMAVGRPYRLSPAGHEPEPWAHMARPLRQRLHGKEGASSSPRRRRFELGCGRVLGRSGVEAEQMHDPV